MVTQSEHATRPRASLSWGAVFAVKSAQSPIKRQSFVVVHQRRELLMGRRNAVDVHVTADLPIVIRGRDALALAEPPPTLGIQRIGTATKTDST
jgi:hypothetical protein